MFAAIVLPFQLTVALFSVVWLTGVFILRNGKKTAQMSVLMILLFFPSCVGMRMLVDAVRYGKSEYATATEITGDVYIDLPHSARNIVLYRYDGGHDARFVVTTEELRKWMGGLQAQRPEPNAGFDDDVQMPEAFQKELLEDARNRSRDSFVQHFGQRGWKFDPTMTEHDVRRSDDGGGFTVWHVPATGETYLTANYW